MGQGDSRMTGFMRSRKADDAEFYARELREWATESEEKFQVKQHVVIVCAELSEPWHKG